MFKIVGGVKIFMNTKITIKNAKNALYINNIHFY